MKRGAVTLKQITQVQLTANLNIFDLLDTGNFYLRLEERRNTVTSLLKGHGVKKGNAVYNSILNNFNYQWIIDLTDSNFYDLSKVIELTEFTPLSLSKTDEEFQKILTGIFYLALDDLLIDHLTTYIKDNNKILEVNCLAAAECLAKMEKLGLALGFPKVSDKAARKKLRQSGKLGGKKKSYNLALQKFVNFLYMNAKTNNISPSLREILTPVKKYSFSKPLDMSSFTDIGSLNMQFDDVFITEDGWLCWKDRKGENAKIRTKNLKPYLDRAKNNSA